MVDYFSQYPEIARVPSTTSQGIILALKKIFSQHGIPERVRSDNGPQYSSTEFAKFTSLYGFQHITSSPHFLRSNGLAERTIIQTVWRMLLKLLSFKSTITSLSEKLNHLSSCPASSQIITNSNITQSQQPVHTKTHKPPLQQRKLFHSTLQMKMFTVSLPIWTSQKLWESMESQTTYWNPVHCPCMNLFTIYFISVIYNHAFLRSERSTRLHPFTKQVTKPQLKLSPYISAMLHFQSI